MISDSPNLLADVLYYCIFSGTNQSMDCLLWYCYRLFGRLPLDVPAKVHFDRSLETCCLRYCGDCRLSRSMQTSLIVHYSIRVMPSNLPYGRVPEYIIL